MRKVERQAFEAMIDHASGGATAQAGQAGHGHGAANGKVIIYGAEWCGACKEAAHYFHEHGVPFVEKDIEKIRAPYRRCRTRPRRPVCIRPAFP